MSLVKFYNSLMKSWLQDNDIDMHSTHNKEKYVAADWFFRTIKYHNILISSISQNVYIDKLDDIVNKYNNTYHKPIKTKPVDKRSYRCKHKYWLW